ncbi:DMT family transporter [Paenibacillus endoradicis]|uniref:DMT family transporter n=1 Tax=Paenibacillus endoradicis TaxID=2972487 RepID=UPI002158CDF7|nr:multidrug efflux SMR transporter [Paenibacillus endoradicis]MCR8656777.1 multidrug efflux SMR transporter [Paenibacillus endoradicis]
MSWLFVIIAGVFEIVGVAGINKLNEKVNAVNILFMALGFGLSFLFLTLALEQLPMGTAYAVWTGIGAAGSAVVGIIFYKESKSIARLVCIAVIIASVIGLKLVS